jgi:Uma2 family endonuclease
MRASSNNWLVMALELKPHRFSIEAYEAMVAHGILTPADRAELIAGEIVEKMTIGTRHAACVRRLHRVFDAALEGRALPSIQSPVRVPPNSEPEPDLAILKPREDDYAHAHPGPSDILLVCEVADSSLELDRSVKLPLYAIGGIAEAWIVNLVENVVEVYSNPVADRYTQSRIVSGEASISPSSLPHVTLRAIEILPP